MPGTFLSARTQWACAVAAIAIAYLQTASIAAGIIATL
jgi:hypothetical protein